jgi:hypothetical protein
MISTKDMKLANSIDTLLVTSISPVTSSMIWPLILFALKHLPIDQVLTFVLSKLPASITPEEKAAITTTVDAILNLLEGLIPA